MSLVQTHDRLQLPGALQTQLLDFRKRVWSIKMIEAACGRTTDILYLYHKSIKLNQYFFDQPRKFPSE